MTHTIRLPGVMGAYGMMGRMIVETPNDNVETLSNQELTGRLDHLDTMLHEIDRKLTAVTAHLDTALGFIDEHKPALTKGLALLDPGAGVRGWLGKHQKH